VNQIADYYSLLGVKRKATPEEIKRAYRRLVFRYHPDRNPNDDEAAAKLKEIIEAYDVLSNSEKRSSYDNATWQPFENSRDGGGTGTVNGFGFAHDFKTKAEPEPRCPKCLTTGIGHVISRKANGASGRGKQFILSPFQIIFCDQCGHVYGVTGS
jgi:DnaJ-class molecular chaperone